tara:strand:+ start:120 stop:236 length:117 start_codon:yes stop_codon:yes gene_type:complete
MAASVAVAAPQEGSHPQAASQPQAGALSHPQFIGVHVV